MTKRANTWNVHTKYLCVVLMVMISTGSFFACGCAHAISIPDKFIKHKIHIDHPNSTLRMFIPTQEELGCIMGQDQETHQDWLALITERGEIKWQITNAPPEYYYGAMERKGIVYLLVSNMGVPLAERTPYLQPITLDGIRQAPVQLPLWIADATMVKASDAVLFFSRSASPLIVAKYDDQLTPIWEKRITDYENTGAFFLDAVVTDDGYVLIGTSHYGQDTVIAKLDADGNPLWSKMHKGKGWIASDVTSCGDVILLYEQTGNNDEDKQYSVLTYDSNGTPIYEQGLELPQKDVALRTILSLPNGAVVSGAIQYGDRAPEVFLLFLDDAYGTLAVVDFQDVKDTVSQIALIDNGTLLLLGIGVDDGGQANGYVVGDIIDLDALWHWLTITEKTADPSVPWEEISCSIR